MRISLFEKNVIVNSIRLFDKRARIFLFGSRANDKLKGGDIDLFIISEKLSFSDKLKIECEIFKYIEEQRIDIVIAKKKNLVQPFNKIALSKAVQL